MHYPYKFNDNYDIWTIYELRITFISLRIVKAYWSSYPGLKYLFRKYFFK